MPRKATTQGASAPKSKTTNSKPTVKKLPEQKIVTKAPNPNESVNVSVSDISKDLEVVKQLTNENNELKNSIRGLYSEFVLNSRKYSVIMLVELIKKFDNSFPFLK